MKKDSTYQNALKSLSFKDLSKSFEDNDGMSFASQPLIDDNLRLIDGDMSDPNKRIAYKVRTWFENTSKRYDFLSFFFDLLSYLGIRIRIFVVLFSVLAEFISQSLEHFKRFVIKNMFWGRGSLFKWSIQFVSIVLAVVILASYSYRSTADASYTAVDVTTLSTLESDLIVQNGSTNTQIPENRGRVDVVKYTVKNGDSLEQVAKTFNLSQDTLLWANQLSSGAIIKPGQELVIPPGNGILVAVKEGDTVEALAQKYRSNPQLIVEQNLLDYPFELKVGAQLFVPDGRPPDPPKPKPTVFAGVVNTGRVVTPGTSGFVDPNVGRFLSWPVGGGSVLSQCYTGYHNGVDIASSPMGSMPNLVAAAPGVVTFAGCQSGSCPPIGSNQRGGSGLAWTVMIDHGNGYTSVYAHMNQIYVSSGQSVGTGQAIGQMGQSGLAFGVHVHFMLLRGGGWNHVNPAAYMANSICGY